MYAWYKMTQDNLLPYFHVLELLTAGCNCWDEVIHNAQTWGHIQRVSRATQASPCKDELAKMSLQRWAWKKKTKMQSTQLTQVRDRRRDTAYDDGRYLHSSWNRSDGARKFSVGIVSPRALPKTYEHRSVLAPSCLSSNRAWKPPQGCYSVTVSYTHLTLPTILRV